MAIRPLKSTRRRPRPMDGLDAPCGDDQSLDWIVGTLLAAKIHIYVKSLSIEQPARGIDRLVEARWGRCRRRRARRGQDGYRGNTGTRKTYPWARWSATRVRRFSHPG